MKSFSGTTRKTCGAIYQSILLLASKKLTVQFDKFVETDEKLLQHFFDIEIRYDQVKFLVDFYYYEWHWITHQLIYCIRKISRIKTGAVYKNIKLRSLKNDAVEVYKNALREKFSQLRIFCRCQSGVFKLLTKINESNWQCCTL